MSAVCLFEYGFRVFGGLGLPAYVPMTPYERDKPGKLLVHGEGEKTQNQPELNPQSAASAKTCPDHHPTQQNFS